MTRPSKQFLYRAIIITTKNCDYKWIRIGLARYLKREQWSSAPRSFDWGRSSFSVSQEQVLYFLGWDQDQRFALLMRTPNTYWQKMLLPRISFLFQINCSRPVWDLSVMYNSQEGNKLRFPPKLAGLQTRLVPDDQVLGKKGSFRHALSDFFQRQGDISTNWILNYQLQLPLPFDV